MDVCKRDPTTTKRADEFTLLKSSLKVYTFWSREVHRNKDRIWVVMHKTIPISINNPHLFRRRRINLLINKALNNSNKSARQLKMTANQSKYLMMICRFSRVN